jgi:two-component system response regulator PilR (NtrC family)
MKDERPAILVVDDEESMREMLRILLSRAGYTPVLAAGGREALNLLESRSFRLMITDIRMKSLDGLSILKTAKEKDPNLPVIMITAYADPQSAVDAMAFGAYDYIPKPFDNRELLLVVDKALHKQAGVPFQTRDKKSDLNLVFELMVGQSPQIERIYELIRKAAQTITTVLITGESGTGKELVARAIHQESSRRKGLFVPISCAGIPESLIESELFGHLKGAFTGAYLQKDGLIKAANGGTVFLDEIGDLSPLIQTKLLRVLQEKKITPLGDTREFPVDVRFIAATNRFLEEEVLAGRFREDLYFRLNVIHLDLPPLRERGEDIGLLADFFLKKYSLEMGKEIEAISAYALEILKGYSFPGNVRELENIIERSVALEATKIVLPESLTLSAFKGRRMTIPESLPEISFPAGGINLEGTLDRMEKDLMLQAIKNAGDSKSKAAELLGISLRSLRYRLIKHGIE